MSFLGTSEHTIDAKGRTSVPSRFRELLAGEYGDADKLIVTVSFDRCLHAHPLKAWSAFMEKLAQRSSQEEGVKQIYRVYVAHATQVEIDKLGRILLPANLRSLGGLEKDVVWVGQVKHMELWSKAGWEKASAEAFSDAHKADVERIFRETGAG